MISSKNNNDIKLNEINKTNISENNSKSNLIIKSVLKDDYNSKIITLSGINNFSFNIKTNNFIDEYKSKLKCILHRDQSNNSNINENKKLSDIANKYNLKYSKLRKKCKCICKCFVVDKDSKSININENNSEDVSYSDIDNKLNFIFNKA